MSGKILPWIPKDRLDVRFSRSSGAGGQGVNRTESKVEMRFRVSDADWLSPYVRERLHVLYPGAINLEDELIVSSQESRSQKDNYQICLEKISQMILSSMKREKKRIPTKKTYSSVKKRLKSKAKRSAIKGSRRTAGDFDD